MALRTTSRNPSSRNKRQAEMREAEIVRARLIEANEELEELNTSLIAKHKEQKASLVQFRADAEKLKNMKVSVRGVTFAVTATATGLFFIPVAGEIVGGVMMGGSALTMLITVIVEHFREKKLINRLTDILRSTEKLNKKAEKITKDIEENVQIIKGIFHISEKEAEIVTLLMMAGIEVRDALRLAKFMKENPRKAVFKALGRGTSRLSWLLIMSKIGSLATSGVKIGIGIAEVAGKPMAMMLDKFTGMMSGRAGTIGIKTIGRALVILPVIFDGYDFIKTLIDPNQFLEKADEIEKQIDDRIELLEGENKFYEEPEELGEVITTPLQANGEHEDVDPHLVNDTYIII